jgi:ubiquinone/menaquinone biosynthesis C-methylase UbiE
MSHHEGQRVDYDQVADRYDVDHLRSKQVDSDLLDFLTARGKCGETCAVLDVGCGTGNQLVANQAHVPGARLVGLDLFHGMLCQARAKSARIAWVQGDGARLPLSDASFDYVTNQFSFHHVRAKEAMLREVFRVLRPAGRFVMTNIAPREMPGWAVYRIFPAAWERDLDDFMPVAEIESLLRQAGFAQMDVESERADLEQDLGSFVQDVRLRVVSQSALLSEADYQAGRQRLETELREADGRAVSIPSELCLCKIVADKE